ncbi:glycosyltransferase [Methylocystis echinoides]|uniref:Glycosyltransferase n=1 Tax=Methylocystis echinoides TaxID=29468 RepID=A0A9W6GX31_9HYPH|nr:glycosyltransferase [Methylocystis echinoides]GLI94516.1 hypothetical protein LMG27198_35080 [Methylocystis echinoides]
MDVRKRPAADDGLTDRILFVVNGVELPTLQLSFTEPLKAVPGVQTSLLTEVGLNAGHQDINAWGVTPDGLEKMQRRLEGFRPTLIVFCRYSGPYAPEIIQWARAARTPTIYHIDDDLLQVPVEIGEVKARGHNQPRRVQTVRYLLDNTTLAYCSNERLRRILFGEATSNRVVTAGINCALDVLAPPTTDDPPVIGYMGFNHDFDFTFALPALVTILQARPEVRFELFGSTNLPDVLKPFGDRITFIQSVRDYGVFVQKLASRRWTIGICPLAKTEFNIVKSNNKWVEYSACGFAVVATRGMIYDACCADGCGLLVDGDDEWRAAFDRLLSDRALHRDQVTRAQKRLRAEYGRDRLRRQISSVFSRARDLASRPDVTKLSLDEFDGDRIWGWAWRSTETTLPSQRHPVELWCGETRLGRIARWHDRPDADAHLGAPPWPKGFSAPVGALNALCRLMGGETGGFHPTLRFHENAASTLAENPDWRSLAAFRTLRAAEGGDWRIDDLWWANSHLLKARASLQARDDGRPPTTLMRLFQPATDANGRRELALVDETPVEAHKGVYAFGLRNPFMPILLVGYDDAGDISFTDLLPFPSLLRGGLHAAEAAAVQNPAGGLDALRRVNDAYLAEAVGWDASAPSPALAEICVDLLKATGAEPVFEPQLCEWIISVFNLPVIGANVGGRIATDLGDPAFVDYAEALLDHFIPTHPREGRLRLTLPCSAVPTISALVSRRLSVDAGKTPGSYLVVDASLTQRRFLLTYPANLPKTIADVVAPQIALSPVSCLMGTDESATGGAMGQSQPVAILFLDLAPDAREKLLHPIPVDAPVASPAAGGGPGRISVFIRLGDADTDIRLLLDSLARQRTGAALEVFLIVTRAQAADAHRGPLLDAFPSSGRIHESASLSAAAAINEAAAAASGDMFVFVDSRAILHDPRTLATISQLALLADVATVGCMLIKPRNTADGAPVFSSAGYFPGRVDFSLAPHLALEQIECGRLLADSHYPVAANSAHFFALSAAAWRQAGGMSLNVPDDGMQIDLALRLARAGRINLCTTRMSVYSEAAEPGKYLHDMAVAAHLDLWNLLPALKSSAAIRSF